MNGRRRRTARRAARPIARTNLRRQAFGNFRSAMQQRDSTNIVISSQENVSMYIAPGCPEATLVRNVNALLCGSDFFANYAGMYDQYKINAVRVAIEILSVGQNISSAQSFPNICTAWDRNGIELRSLINGPLFVKDNTNAANAPIAINAVTMVGVPNYSQVSSYSSANEKTLYYGARWGVVRQLDAASMQEKSMYLPTYNTLDVLTSSNLYSAWNPQLLIALRANSAPVNTNEEVVFSLHWQWDVTLRGLRKSGNMTRTNNVATMNSITNTMERIVPITSYVGFKPSNVGIAVNYNGAWYGPGYTNESINATDGNGQRTAYSQSVNPREYQIPTR